MIQKNSCLQEKLYRFAELLKTEEKSKATVEKYLRDTAAFLVFLSDKELSKKMVLEYKEGLVQKGYAVRSVNSMLASVNKFLHSIERDDCQVRGIRLQREIFCPEEKELTKEEYMRLLTASENNPRLHLMLQVICATGIRVSELRFFTVEAIRNGEIRVFAKNKSRVVLLPGKLKKKISDFAQRRGIRSGPVFCTRSGNPLDRSYIWAAMKKLCSEAKVDPRKVFPHNLRKLFARIFYGLCRDIAKLADVLGHSSINTTRIYIISTGKEHREVLERLALIV